MKLAVIGGGGVRCILLAKSLAYAAPSVGLTDVVFMDNDEEKLNIFGKMARETSRRLAPSLNFSLTTDPVEAVRDADFVITTIRVGQDKMRIADERIALKHDVLGQETTGAGGFSMAMRSIPVLVEYCELIRKYASPEVKVFNFTNPAGLVSQALREKGYDFTYGICDSPTGLLHTIADMLHCDFSQLSTECYGLNHLSFFKSICLDGKDITQQLLADDRLYQQTDMRYFSKELAQHFGMLLNEYLYYYFYREKAVDNVQNAGCTRGEMIEQINQSMIEELKKLDPEKDFDECVRVFEHWYGEREDRYMCNETSVGNGREPFRLNLQKDDGGGYAGVALSYIKSVANNRPSEMILCVPNDGGIPELAPDDVVEITCRIDGSGHHVKPVGEVNEAALEMIRRVKYFERRAAHAILTRDKELAVEALMFYPLVNSYSLAKELVEEYIQSNEPFCPGWK